VRPRLLFLIVEEREKEGVPAPIAKPLLEEREKGAKTQKKGERSRPFGNQEAENALPTQVKRGSPEAISLTAEKK